MLSFVGEGREVGGGGIGGWGACFPLSFFSFLFLGWIWMDLDRSFSGEEGRGMI